MDRHRIACATFVAALSLSLCSAAHARLYRWVDADGNVYYSDQQPPDASQQGRTELNERGHVVETIERAKTKEELEEEQRRAAFAAEQQRKLDEQRRYDRVLLDTFTTERELTLVRDDRLSTLDGQISAIQKKLTEQQARLDNLNNQAKYYQQQNEPLPAHVASQLKDAQNQVATIEQFMKRRQFERNEIAQRFDDDLARFRRLKSASN